MGVLHARRGGPLRGRRARRLSRREDGCPPNPTPTPRAAGPANGASSPRPGVGAPLALLPYLPRGLRSPLFGRPQP